ncbi:conjugal transfer protein TraF [Hydrogenovibrio halophilus]|uniref:conjugal transfer protein TraF n=1 Tax=Hydrogenovibrio halophilus TaxID=373391 RepID=UPI0003A29889|nr:conjugal transfer protein TraF [Hydrogenovibrio halophilus]
MQKTLITAMMAAISTSAVAAPNGGPLGTNIGYGDSSNSNTIYGPIANPSHNALNVSDTDGYRVGFGISGNISMKSNGLEGSEDYIDTKIDGILDKSTYDPQDATDLAEAINDFTKKYDEGSLSVSGGVTVPILVKHDVMGGGISFDYSRQYAVKAQMHREGNVAATYVDADEITVTKKGAGMAFHYKEVDEFALGYGREAYYLNKNKWYDGVLNVGVSARYINMTASATAIDFGQYTEDNLKNNNQDADDYLDNIENGASDSNITADIGVDWTADNFMVSLAGKNLTSPTFDVDDQSTGYNFGIDDEYTMEPRFTMGGQWYSNNRNWTLAGSIDLNEANDLNDNDTQWWSASASYATNSAWYIPDARIGMRGNMSEDGYNYVTAGLTLGMLTMDVATTTTDFSGVSDNQEDEGVMASVGLEFDF